jgi:hypothetical protein
MSAGGVHRGFYPNNGCMAAVLLLECMLECMSACLTQPLENGPVIPQPC